MVLYGGRGWSEVIRVVRDVSSVSSVRIIRSTSEMVVVGVVKWDGCKKVKLSSGVDNNPMPA